MTNFDLAPPPVTIGGALAVPIDIDHIDAALTFDVGAQTATGDATIHFTTGPADGHPLFDLVPAATAAWLDGTSFDPALATEHQLGLNANDVMRRGPSPLTASTDHTLRFQYALSAAPAGTLVWETGARLRFQFDLRDLQRRRYLERWIPANLIYDQFTLRLTLNVVGTAVAHRVVTNATVTDLAANTWQLDFPARFTALSPLVEIHAADRLEDLSGTVTPLGGTPIAIALVKLTDDAAVSLGPALASIQSWLSENSNEYGPYLHDGRFVGVIRSTDTGMEYEGGVTAPTAPFGSVSPLRHEVFHSWFARGVKPASQPDGWWDEAMATWHDDGASVAFPLDYTAAPVGLAPREPYSRLTQVSAYQLGERLLQGLAAMTSPAQLRAAMRQFFVDHSARPATTQEFESLLLARWGRPEVVDAFHRFAFGFGPTTSAVQLRPRTAGDPDWDAPFWDSPNLWIGHEPTGVTGHSPPIEGEDNWFYARVTNPASAGVARHFAVTFTAKHFAGVEFVYPADFLPAIAAVGDFELAPGEEKVVSARWPAALVPPEGTHTCMLASVHAWQDHPGSSKHVWEDTHLAQKNLTVVRAGSGEFAEFSFQVDGSPDRRIDRARMRWHASWKEPEIELVEARRKHPPVKLDKRTGRPSGPAPAPFADHGTPFPRAGIPVTLRHGYPRWYAVRVRVPEARTGDVLRLHIYKERVPQGVITGGVTLEIHVT